MMKRMKVLALVAVVSGLLPVFGTIFYPEYLDLAGVNEPVVPGQWHLGWRQCYDYANAHDLPLFAVWSNRGCDHCNSLDNLFLSEAFKKWQAESPKSKIVLCFMAGGEPGWPDQENSEGFKWAGGPWPGESYYIAAFPFVALYWKSQGVNYHTNGDTFVGTYPVFDKQREAYAEKIIQKIESYFKDFPMNKDSGVSFTVGADAGLEIEYGKTTYVDVPLARTNDVSFAETNAVKATVNGAVVQEMKIEWAKLQDSGSVRLTVKPAWTAGTRVVLDVYDPTGKEVKDSTSVTVVAPLPVSASNPRWKGAALGEWTMDLDAANGLASRDCTLVLFTGALWCPHCKGLERQVFNSQDFKNFSSRMALVVLDNPHRKNVGGKNVYSDKPDGLPPTLLRYASGVADYASGRIDSGASYMTRNMVDVNEAERILQRNHTLGYDTWCLPDSNWTGYPTLLLLRKDGSIAGRLAWTETGTKTDADGQTVGVFDVPATMKRLQELVDLAKADPTEEKNGHWTTTTLSIPAQSATPLTGTLDANDTIDVVKIDFQGDLRVKATFRGDESAPVIVHLLQDDGAKGIELKSVKGDLKDGVSISSVYEGSTIFASIEADASAASSPFSPFSTAQKTTRTYSMTTVAVITPGDDEKTRTFPAGTRTVTIQLTVGKVYRIEGLAEDLGTDKLVAIQNTDHLYRAAESCDLELPLPNTPGAHTVKCRVWETGTVGFASATTTVSEESGGQGSRLVTIPLPRVGGVSGKVTGTVRLVPEESTIKPEDGRIIWAGDTTVEWADGDKNDQEISFILIDDEFYDPVQTVVFKLDLSADSVAGISEGLDKITVSIRDNDKVAVGRLSITDSDPQFARQMTVVAAEGDKVSFNVRREAGAFGDASAYLEVRVDGAAVRRSDPATWKDGQRESDRIMTVTVPTGCTRAEVVIVPTGIKADTARGRVTLLVVDKDAPKFATGAVQIDGIRSFVSEETSVALESGSGSFVEKVSGSLPDGIEVSYDTSENKLVVRGTPAASGAATAVYQVYGFDPMGGLVKGTTVALNFDVADSSDIAKVVPSIAGSRQFVNEMIFETGGDGVNRLAGALSIALPANGRASAKIMSENGVESFSAKGWGVFDSEKKTVSVTLESSLYAATHGIMGDVMTATVDAKGIVTVEASFSEPSRTLSATLGETEWTGSSTPASFKGMYTVQLPQLEPIDGSCGDGFIVLKLTEDAAASGRMLYAGGLPNGRYFSGGAYLKPAGDYADLPVVYFCRDLTASSFAGALEITPNVATTDKNGAKGWVKPMPGTLPWWSANFIGGCDMEAYGGRPDVSLTNCCMTTYQTLNLAFRPVVENPPWTSAVYGELQEFIAPTLNIGDRSIMIDERTNLHRLRLAFNPETGVVSGTVALPFEKGDVNATYRGVILPGWEDCGCGRPDPTVRVSRPFASGSIWFSEGLYAPNAGCGFKVCLPEK